MNKIQILKQISKSKKGSKGPITLFSNKYISSTGNYSFENNLDPKCKYEFELKLSITSSLSHASGTTNNSAGPWVINTNYTPNIFTIENTNSGTLYQHYRTNDPFGEGDNTRAITINNIKESQLYIDLNKSQITITLIARPL